MSDRDDGGPAAMVDVPGTGHYGLVVLNLRDYFAGQAMQGMIAASYGDEGYVPHKMDSDFVKDPEGKWRKSRFGYWRSPQDRHAEGDGEPHRLVTTHEQRLAREAYSQADAMLAAREAGRE